MESGEPLLLSLIVRPGAVLTPTPLTPRTSLSLHTLRIAVRLNCFLSLRPLTFTFALTSVTTCCAAAYYPITDIATMASPNTGFISSSVSSTNSALTDYEVEVVEIRVKEGELKDIIP